ncbi:uncharacterized protein N7479_001788 [Penicillium vulpinum]|uniref:F-box domain-containing protein n=1 Tax=Penicillium vulpinum TaxID=29845 RepID=A0A1V6RCI4_9EURO|nr:uncharacterized protein N7479_001788 [Penicillium vulpinum]KAJ5971870.1 hypothetical protein N7479_001788 [Penicillium vulpinum]OQD98936.1 hypothetical protein PENVUL_c068G01133 [Penicillium vulpinum]
MSLQSFPDEILLRILSYLPSHTDAAALSLQCHRWHRLCDMSNRRKYRRIKLREPFDLTVAFKMLRSILKTPQYGRYIRYIELNRSPSLDYGYVHSYTVKPPQWPIRPKDQVRLTAAVRRAGFNCPEEQEKVLNILLQSPGSMHHNDPRVPFLAQALAALLISVSPLLESLSFCPVGQEPSKLSKLTAQANGTPLRECDYFFKHFLDRANCSPQETLPFLQHLRQVRFLVDPDTRIYRWYYYQPYDLYGSFNMVRRLPAVESVRVDAIMSTQSPSIEPPPRSANYTSITIRNSNVDYQYLVRAIESAKRLEEFTYAVGGRGSSDGMFSMFSPDHVFRALFLHTDSLVHLDLDVEAETPLAETFDPTLGQYLFDDSNDRSPRAQQAYQQEWVDELQKLQPEQGGQSSPCSLRGLTKVKNLSLGIHTLYYLSRGIGADQGEDASFAIVDHLPPNLEALCIYGYEKGMKPRVEGLPDDVFDKQLEQLLAEKDAKLPCLSYIEGIDECIENATTVKQPATNNEDLWEEDTDDEWTDHEYDD